MKKDTLSHPPKQLKTRMPFNLFMLLLLLVAGAIFTLAVTRNQETRQRASGGVANHPDLSFNPPSPTIPYGNSANLGLYINTNKASVTKAEIHLHFNHDKVQLSFTPGTALQQVSHAFSSSGDDATVTLSKKAGDQPVKGNAVLGTLTVKQIAGAGTSTISFSTTTRIISNASLNGALLGFLQPASIRGTVTAPNVDINFNPVSDTLAKNQSRSFGLNINTNNQNVTKANIHFTFNADQVRLAFTPGPALPKVTKTFTVTGNTAEVTLEEQSAGHPYNGSATAGLGSLTVKQIGTKDSTVKLSGTVVKQEGNPGNAAGTLGTLSINYPNPPTPTPTGPTPKPTPALKPTISAQACSGTTPYRTINWTGGYRPASFTVKLYKYPYVAATGYYTRVVGITQSTNTLNGFVGANGSVKNKQFVPALNTSYQVSIGNGAWSPGSNGFKFTACEGSSNRSADFYVSFDGVTGNGADGKPIDIWLEKYNSAGNVALTTKLDTTALAYTGYITAHDPGFGIYKTSAAIPTNDFPAGTVFKVVVRGQKHLATIFTALSGQNNTCDSNSKITMPTGTDTVTFNFAANGAQLPAGDTWNDTTPRTNSVTTDDLANVSNIFNNIVPSAMTDQDKMLGDLNYDGTVDNLDWALINNTIQTRCAQ